MNQRKRCQALKVSSNLSPHKTSMNDRLSRLPQRQTTRNTLKIAVIHLVAFQFTLCKHVKQSNEHFLHDRCQHAQSEVLRRDLWPLPKFLGAATTSSIKYYIGRVFPIIIFVCFGPRFCVCSPVIFPLFSSLPISSVLSFLGDWRKLISTEWWFHGSRWLVRTASVFANLNLIKLMKNRNFPETTTRWCCTKNHRFLILSNFLRSRCGLFGEGTYSVVFTSPISFAEGRRPAMLKIIASSPFERRSRKEAGKKSLKPHLIM